MHVVDGFIVVAFDVWGQDRNILSEALYQIAVFRAGINAP